MEALELLELIQKGESSSVQFKESINHINQLVQEFSAMANTEGGYIIIGISDKGEIKGLSANQIHQLNQWISNAASQNIKPPISPITEIVTVSNQNILVIKIPSGYSKPYYTNEGVAYVKMGADKRIAPPEEILRLFQSGGKIYADEGPVIGSTMNDIDDKAFKELIINKFRNKLDGEIGELSKKTAVQLLASIDPEISAAQLLQNMKLYDHDNGALTLAGLLLIGANPQKFKPLFSVRCIAFAGTEITGEKFLDKEDLFEGNLLTVYEKTMNFVSRNLRQIQPGDGFNALGRIEIPRQVMEEIIVNSLVHRDYFINASIQVLIFDDRIEIISPGKLPNTLNENNIKYYTSIARNPIIYSNCAFAGLPFTGIGSGIPRAVSLYPPIRLVNDQVNEKFTVIIKRP